jgi:hypothetical protein
VQPLLLVVSGLQNPLLDASRNGPLTQYNLLAAEVQRFAETDKVNGDESFFISASCKN